MPRNDDPRDQRRRPDRREDRQSRQLPGRPPKHSPNTPVEGVGLLGRIDKIVGDKGFGFISGANGIRYFFHFSTCLPSESVKLETVSEGARRATFDNLYEGERVKFSAVRDAKGPRCELLVSLENPMIDGPVEPITDASAQAAGEVLGNKA